MTSDPIYLAACGIVWRADLDPDAGGELLAALRSDDPLLHDVAESMLVNAGMPSIDLIETALSAGSLSAKDAGACLLKLLRCVGQPAMLSECSKEL